MRLSKKNKQDRYPGLSPFSEDQAGVFFGREKETVDLYHMIRASRAVVLFSKSGLGKSSLLNAGISPVLLENSYMPVKIRFNKKQTEGEELIEDPFETFRNSFSEHLKNRDAIQSNDQLWEVVKRCNFSQANTPVVIFDQFEEFFHHPADSINKFLVQLSELIHDHAPSRILDTILGIPLERRKESDLEWVIQPAIKFVFSIRADRLSELQKMEQIIPSIFNYRYELKPMNEINAESAIVEPAKAKDNEKISYTTAPFSFEKNNLKTIIRKLKDKDQEIESSQLQIICQSIEKKIGKLLPGKTIKNVDSLFFNAETDVEIVLDNFYEDQLSSVGTEQDVALCRYVLEEFLLINGRRVSLDHGLLLKILNNKRSVLNRLIGTRLIKEDDTKRGLTYEISHDSLIEPILKSKSERTKISEKASIRLSELKEANELLKASKMDLLKDAASLDRIENCISIYDRHNEWSGQIDARIVKGQLFQLKQDFSSSDSIFQEALVIAKQSGIDSLIGWVYEQLGSLSLLQFNSEIQDPEQSNSLLSFYEQALGHYKKSSNTDHLAKLEEHLGVVYERLFEAYQNDEFAEKSGRYYGSAMTNYELLTNVLGQWRTESGLRRMNKKNSVVWGFLCELFTGNIYPLSGKSVAIGRNTQEIINDIGFSSHFRYLSRRHAKIDNQLKIEDTQSLNGTTINAAPLLYGKLRKLKQGDLIVLANIIPLQFSKTQFENRYSKEGCWGVVIESFSRKTYFLSGNREYSMDLVNDESRQDEFGIQFSDRIESDHLIAIRFNDGIPQFKAKAKRGRYKDQKGAWKIRIAVKDSREYVFGICEEDKWTTVVGIPMQPILFLGDLEADVTCSSFQIVINPEFTTESHDQEELSS